MVLRDFVWVFLVWMNDFEVDSRHFCPDRNREEGLSNTGVPEQPGLITRPPKKVLQNRIGIAASKIEE